MKIKRSDLDKMSQEDLHQLVTHALKIKEASRHRRQEVYLENAYPEQIQFLKSIKRGRGFLGGNRTGKTTTGSNELIWRARGNHPFRKQLRLPRKQVVVLPDFENHCKNIFEPKLNEWAPPNSFKVERNQMGSIRKILWDTGSVTDVLSHDQDLKVFEGADWDDAWFDEPPPHRIFKAVTRGLTDRGGDWWITATPLTDPWMFHAYKAWEVEPEKSLWDFWIVEMDKNAKNLGEGNEALGLKRIEEYISLLDEEEKASRRSGSFMQLQGLIFKTWSRRTHMIKPFQWPYKWKIIETIDPHPRKPAGVSWVGIAENGAKILLRAVYIEGDTAELGEQIIQHRAQLGIVDNRPPAIARCLIDNSANAPLTGKSTTVFTGERVTVRTELENIIGPRGAGGPRLESPPKDVMGKISALKSWLTVREREDGRTRSDFFVFDCPETEDFVDEIETYAWARLKTREKIDFKDQPVKRNDDILDSVMQVAILYRPEHLEDREASVIVRSLGTYGSRG